MRQTARPVRIAYLVSIPTMTAQHLVRNVPRDLHSRSQEIRRASRVLSPALPPMMAPPTARSANEEHTQSLSTKNFNFAPKPVPATEREPLVSTDRFMSTTAFGRLPG